MGNWKVTARLGSEVRRSRCTSLDQALELISETIDTALRAERSGPVKAIRTYERSEIVGGRIEISSPGLLRSRDAGIDVMGDGRLIAYAGSVRKKELANGGKIEAIDALRAEFDQGGQRS
jgi:hypothetical protein